MINQPILKRDVKRQAILDTAYRLFRTQGFDKTSVSEITAQVGGSKATIYSHFPSKEELFVECMTAATESYLLGTLAKLDESSGDLGAALQHFGESYLQFICTCDMVAMRRLMIAEAERSGVGKHFAEKNNSLRAHMAAFLSNCMASGRLRRDNPDLAAHHLRALLEAEVIDPLLLKARETPPDNEEIRLATQHAVSAFLRAYAP